MSGIIPESVSILKTGRIIRKCRITIFKLELVSMKHARISWGLLFPLHNGSNEYLITKSTR